MAMQNNTIQKRLGNAGRIFFLSFACLGLSTMLIWTLAPGWVNNLDKRIVAEYTNRHAAVLEKAEQLLSLEDKTSGIQLLEEYLNSIAHIKKNDRIDPIKREGFRLLTKALSQSKNLDRAFHWFDQWYEFDDKDIYAKVDKASLMSKHPEYSQEGERLLEDLVHRFPFEYVVNAYASMKASKGFHAQAKAYRISYAYQSWMEKSKGAWEILWDTGNGFNEKQRMPIFPLWKDGNRIFFSMTLPKGIRNVRVDIPPYCQTAIADTSLIMTSENMEKKLSIEDASVTSNQMIELGAGILMTTGDVDPFISWAIVPPEFTTEIAQATFQTSVYPSLFHTYEIKNLGEAKSITEAIRSIGKDAIAEIFLMSWKSWENNISTNGPANDV